jgi:hypothetical protein
MSALPPKADILQRIEHVCFVPIADIAQQPMSLSVRAWIYRLDFFHHVADGEARCLGPRRELLETFDIPRD